MNNISSVKDCTACGACINACACNAIHMDESGLFYRPAVDDKICVNCGKCLKVCPIANQVSKMNVIGAYSAVNTDSGVVRRSSSGGVFTALAEMVLKKGGICYGAAFDESNKKVIFSSTEKSDLDALRRSKYVESFTGTVFFEIKQMLDEGKYVLFCGTPCQAAGLKAFLRESYDKLIICDFSCGGLPSHKMYKEYLETLEKRYSSKIAELNFRPKTFGWRRHAISLTFENGKKYIRLAERDPFFSAFIHKKLNVRDCCLNCRFADKHRSDITLADFWLSERITGIKDNDTGISLVLTNTQKGEEALAKLNTLTLSSLKIEDAVYNLVSKPAPESALILREKYMSEYETSGVWAAGEKYITAKGMNDLKLRLIELFAKTKR